MKLLQISDATESTSSSVQPIFFVHVKIRRILERLGECGRGFVNFIFSAMFLHLLDLYMEFLRHFYRDKIFQTTCMLFLINYFMFLWWVVLAHQEVTKNHKQKFYNKHMGILKRELPSHTGKRFGLEWNRGKCTWLLLTFSFFILYILKMWTHSFFFPIASRRTFF